MPYKTRSHANDAKLSNRGEARRYLINMSNLRAAHGKLLARTRCVKARAMHLERRSRLAIRVVLLDPRQVVSTQQFLPPGRIRQIPIDRRSNPGRKITHRRIA